MKKNAIYKLNSYFISLIFFLVIFIPFSISVFKVDNEVSMVEKRKLSKLPKLPVNIKEIERFPAMFNRYYADHFGLRELFTHYYKMLKYLFRVISYFLILNFKDSFKNSIKLSAIISYIFFK